MRLHLLNQKGIKMSEETLARELFPYYLQARAWLVQRREEYARECAEWRAQGFRPHHCIHGVNMWVDYDCACAECELDDRSDLQIARDLAKREFAYRLRAQALIAIREQCLEAMKD